MWYVYYSEDSPQCGWIVGSREEAEEYCEKHPDYRYTYIG